MHLILKKGIPHLLAILSFVIFSSIYFYPQFQGKTLSQSDMTQWYGFSQETREYRQQEKREILWTNSIFIGMPTNFVTLAHPTSLTIIRKISYLFFGSPTGLFLAFLLCAYIMFVCLKIPPLLSFFGSIAIAYTTNNLILLEAGHMTKLVVLASTSLIVGGFILVTQKKYYWGGALFGLGLTLSINGDHIQMTYYLALCMMIGVIVYIIRFIRQRDYAHIARSALVLLAASTLALSANVSKLWSNYELSQETMRGKPVLSEVSSREATSSSQTDGLSWDYAMAWSNNWLDAMALLIPGVVGGGSGEKVGPGAASYDALRRGGVAPHTQGKYMLPMYWGALPFTSGPIYAGAIICFLFVLGLFLIKNPLKWWLGLAVLLTVLLSLGKNFESFQLLFFDYLPMFNKFRTPNSILSVTVLLMPVLAVMALWETIYGKHDRKQIVKSLLYATGITGGVCLLFILGAAGNFFTFQGVSDQQIQQSGFYQQILEDRKYWMSSDAFRSLMFIMLTAGLIWIYLAGKLKAVPVIAGIGFLMMWDMVGVNLRYVHPDDFSASAQMESFFTKRPVDEQILSNEPHRGAYRVLDLSINTFNSSKASFYHNTVGGYHAAKLQRVQDIIDQHVSKNNTQVLNMLNTKYIINREEQLSLNPDALGNAWLVSNIRIVNTPQEEIDGLNEIDPANTAIVLDREFNQNLGQYNPSGEGSIRLSHYLPDHWTYEFQSESDQFAVFSEAWFGTGGGLKAYIDGNEVPFVRANYLLRGLKVPAGSHTIEFKFLPRSYVTGLKISKIGAFAVLLLILGLSAFSLFQYLKQHPSEAEQQLANKEIEKPSRKPKSAKKRR